LETKLFKEESKRFNTYNKAYERVREMILSQLGMPTKTDTTAQTVKSNRGTYFIRETLWETEDVNARLNMIFEAATYRVRFTLYWKK
jgi:hypothetical protein